MFACYLVCPPSQKNNFFKCHQSAPYLSLVTALITFFSLLALFSYIPENYWAQYFIFISALIVTIRTDAATMLISRFVSLFLVPLGIALSALKLLPITLKESLLGAFIGYIILWIVSKAFYIIRKKEGIGQGDLELLAFIGSFIGPVGCWFSLFFGATLGSFAGILYAIKKRQFLSSKLPFGPFLAFGALLYIFFSQTIFSLLLQF